jgi:hydroxyacylglutathione hydrolase
MSEDLRLIAVPALSDNYVWVLADASGAAIVVDPGEASPVRGALARESLELTAVLLTHHHPDHIAGAAELADGGRMPIYAPDDDRIAIGCRRVGDGDRVSSAHPRLGFEVLAVPGHTRSHIAYYGHGVVFCGDTLFSVGCGRIFEGTPREMLASLDRLAALPGETRVCCGHEYTVANCAFARTVDPDNAALDRRSREARESRARGAPTLPSPLAEERACNPFLRVDAPAIVAALPHAADRVARFAELRRRKDEFRAPTP